MSTDTAIDDATLSQKLVEEQPCMESIWAALQQELIKTGLEDAQTILPGLDLATHFIKQDPFDQSKTLHVVWRDKHGALVGEFQIRDSGAIFAEMDVIRNHPTKSKWFIEGVSAWGKKTDIKTELKLLPAV